MVTKTKSQWYSIFEINSGIPILLTYRWTSETNLQQILSLVGIIGTTKVGLFQFNGWNLRQLVAWFHMGYHLGEIKKFDLSSESKVEFISDGFIV